MKTFYIVIADIHGELDKLNRVLSDCEAWIVRERTLGRITALDSIQWVFLGDYIDRGPDSREVVMKVKEYVEEKGAWALRGNHDEFLVGTVEHTMCFFDTGIASNLELWEINGGLETCRKLFPDKNFSSIEYCINYLKRDVLYEFLSSLPYLKETKHIYFCHAPQSNLNNITNSSLIWGNSKDYIHGKKDEQYKVPGNKKLSIHGHHHRLQERIFFPRIIFYNHSNSERKVICADCGCGCAPQGQLHPVILLETDTRAEVVAIL